MAPEDTLSFDIEKSSDTSQNQVTAVKFHGKLVSTTVPQMRDFVKPLIPIGVRIILDMTDLSFLVGRRLSLAGRFDVQYRSTADSSPALAPHSCFLRRKPPLLH